MFSAVDDDGRSLDQETCEKLFRCTAVVRPLEGIASEAEERLAGEARRHAQATIAGSLERNNRFFQRERERIERWAEDMVIAAEKDLADTKAQIRALNRQARLAATTEEQHVLQVKIQELDREKRRQRQRIFDVEDEISEKRDRLIAALERRLSQRTSCEPLFTIRWSVV